jgi:TetR/AcrR family transcriptional regulator
MSGRADLAARRNELMDTIRAAAISEFAAHGLRGASTDAIARRAGISKTKLHYYITSKEELYEDVLKNTLRTWSEMFLDVSAEKSPEASLREYIANRIRHAIENPDEARLFANEVMRGAHLLKDYWYSSRLSTLAAADRIKAWADNGLIRAVDPTLLQFHIWAIAQFYALNSSEVRFVLDISEDQTLDTEYIVSEITQLVLSGLQPRNDRDRGRPRGDRTVLTRP